MIVGYLEEALLKSALSHHLSETCYNGKKIVNVVSEFSNFKNFGVKFISATQKLYFKPERYFSDNALEMDKKLLHLVILFELPQESSEWTEYKIKRRSEAQLFCFYQEKKQITDAGKISMLQIVITA